MSRSRRVRWPATKAPGSLPCRSTPSARSGWPSYAADCPWCSAAAGSTSRTIPHVPRARRSRPHVAGRMLWKGDVEAIPFPFHCGVLDRIDSPQNDGRRHFDFDEAGERILVVGRYGLLFTWRIDGTDSEILPRPLVDDEVMRPVKTVLGVARGICPGGLPPGVPDPGALRPDDSDLHHPYDRSDRVQGLLVLLCRSARDRRSSGERPAERGDRPGDARSQSGNHFESRSRRQAQPIVDLLPYPLSVSQIETSPSDHWIRFESPRSESRVAIPGRLRYRQGAGEMKSLIPLADGRPALKGRHLVQTRQGGDVLAVLAERMSGAALYFISISRDMLLGIFSLGDRYGRGTFALSRQGTRFALLHGDRRARGARRPRQSAARLCHPQGRRRGSILRRWDGRVSWSASSMPGNRGTFGLNV